MKVYFISLASILLIGCAGAVYDKETSSLSDYTKLKREVTNHIIRDNAQTVCKKDQIVVLKKRTFNERYEQGKEPKLATNEQLKQFGLENSEITFLFSQAQDVVSFTDYWEIEKCGIAKRYRIDVERNEKGHTLKIANFPLSKKIQADREGQQPNK